MQRGPGVNVELLPPGTRAIWFDAVGTLIHPDPPAPLVYAEVGRRFGSRLSAETIPSRFLVAFGRQEAFDQAHGQWTSEAREQQRWRQIVAEVLDDVPDPGACFAELFAHFARPGAWWCDPDAAELLKALADRGYLLGMASNYDRRLRSVVAGRPELALIRHLVISSEVGWRKPAPEFFAALCGFAHLAGCRPEQVVFVGDDLVNDYEGARSAGLQPVWFDPQRRAGGVIPPVIRRIERLTDLVAGDT